MLPTRYLLTTPAFEKLFSISPSLEMEEDSLDYFDLSAVKKKGKGKRSSASLKEGSKERGPAKVFPPPFLPIFLLPFHPSLFFTHFKRRRSQLPRRRRKRFLFPSFISLSFISLCTSHKQRLVSEKRPHPSSDSRSRERPAKKSNRLSEKDKVSSHFAAKSFRSLLALSPHFRKRSQL